MSKTRRWVAHWLILSWTLVGVACLAPTEGPTAQSPDDAANAINTDTSNSGPTDNGANGDMLDSLEITEDASGNTPPVDVADSLDTVTDVVGGNGDGINPSDATTSGETSESDGVDNGAESLCEATGGSWNPGSCGHWVCGNSPDCEAVIPGCNCGASKVFDEALGCVDSEDCDVPETASALCANSGGEWLEGTCGNWECGLMPMCKAIIPGCNCGSGMVFDEKSGCIESADCGEIEAEAHQKMCEATGGEWIPESCGDWKCGLKPLCKALVPGCNCGAGMSFDTQTGCYMDPTCGGI